MRPYSGVSGISYTSVMQYMWNTYWRIQVSSLGYLISRKSLKKLSSDALPRWRPPSIRLLITTDTEQRYKIKSLIGEMLLSCQQMAAGARWAYGEHQSTMRSMFVFCQQYILLGPFPRGLLWTYMKVICLNSSEKNEREREERSGGEWSWDFEGLKSFWEVWTWSDIK